MCVCVCPQKHDAERLTALGWAGGCLSENSSLRGCCTAAACGEQETGPEEFKRYLYSFLTEERN